MEAAKAYDWLARQVEDHGPTAGGGLKTAIRLVDAASGLKTPHHDLQIFGLAIAAAIRASIHFSHAA